MNSFELQIWDDECEKVTFYTARWLELDENETDRFFLKYETTHKEAVQKLISLLYDVIGTDYGALDEFFNRPENDVFGLPPHGKITIGEVTLRLFTISVTSLCVTAQ